MDALKLVKQKTKEMFPTGRGSMVQSGDEKPLAVAGIQNKRVGGRKERAGTSLGES